MSYSKKIYLTGRTLRLIEAAKKTAEKSPAPDYRHGALLVKGNSIVGSAYNKNSFNRWGNRFRHRDCGHATHHAELGCILGKDRSVTTGATIYVVRIGKKGEFRMSKPCPMCEAVMRHVGIKKVVYTINYEEVGVHKL